MTTVGIDCRFGSALAGLGTYTRSLVSALAKRDDTWSLTLFVQSPSEKWLQPLLDSGRVTLRAAAIPHYSFREQTDLPNLIQDAECDLFYSLQFNVPLFCPVPFICTVHDLILHRFPSEATIPKRLAYRFVMRNTLRNAEHIFAVSESSKSDIGSSYGQGIEGKTTVTCPGVDSSFTPATKAQQDAVRARHQLDRPFLLYVGNCKQHKNVQTLIAAFKAANLPGIELVLVCGGRECARVRKSESVRFLPNVSPDDLSALYSSALGCITATLAEGFCLPLVEAMACRCPVLATKIGPIPEVCGSHADLVEPTVHALADGMRRLVTDPATRSTARLDAARKWMRRYSWPSAAEKTAEVIRGIPA